MNNDKVKISANKQKKTKIVAEISEKVGKAKAMVFTNYQGITHKQLEQFKRDIKKSDAEFAVAKNTLLKKSLVDANLETGDDKNFDQPTGAIFLYGDIVAPLKILAKMIKEMEKPQIKFGLLDGKLMTKEQVIKLSTLPSREVLIAQLLGQMKAPIAGFHRALHWNLQKFVMTLSAIEKKKANSQ
jgi:large subunit ribosomal protein L10